MTCDNPMEYLADLTRACAKMPANAQAVMAEAFRTFDMSKDEVVMEFATEGDAMYALGLADVLWRAGGANIVRNGTTVTIVHRDSRAELN